METIGKMKCPKCVRLGLKSNVYGGIGSITLMYCQPYYDEEGEYHHHDSNTREHEYNCDKGHKWLQVSYGSCWCGWTGGKTEIIYLNDPDEDKQ